VEDFLQVAAALHGFEHGDFVRVFEVRADRNTHANAGDPHAQRLQQFGKIDRSGFALGSGVGGDDDFFHRALLQAFDQGFYFELLGPAPLQRRERTAQHVVHAVVGARFLDGEDVVGLFDHANGLAVARGSDAIQAWIGVGDVVARRALANLFFGISNGVGEPERVFRRRAQDKKCEALRGFLSNAGKMFEFVDEAFDRSGKIGHE
jgi:hypothetical protein